MMRKKYKGFTLIEIIFSVLIFSGCLMLVSQYSLHSTLSVSDITADNQRLSAVNSAYNRLCLDLYSENYADIQNSKITLETAVIGAANTVEVVNYELSDGSLYRNGEVLVEDGVGGNFTDKLSILCGSKTMYFDIGKLYSKE